MRRDHLLIIALGMTMLAVLLGGAALAAGPSAPADLLPPGAALVSFEGRGLGRAAVVMRMPPRQNRHTVYRHLVGMGWQLRRVNVLRDDADQSMFRRSLEGHLLESAVLSRDSRDPRTVTILYYRCLRRLTCRWN